ncbi:Fcf1-domain-containing protein [Scleroderma yunnanense]
MRQKRAKTYRKLMSLYRLSFGFREPYQVLVDAEMCRIATESHINLEKQLGTVLQGSVKPMITQCCIHELYLQGKAQQPTVDLAKTFERRKCNHKEAIPGDECLASVVGDTNKHRYVIATLSQPLRAQLRLIPAVPIVHINRAVMILEPPSDETLKVKRQAEQQALGAAPSELAKMPLQRSDSAYRKKGPKGPNPLSVKKKVIRTTGPSTPRSGVGEDSSVGDKRKREGEDEQVATTRKKKRRRKHAGSAPTPVAA